MTSYDLALLLHLVAVIGFFAGMALAAAAQFAAWGRSRPCEIAAVLSLARTGVLLVGAGALLVLGSGLWLIEETGRSLGDGWIALSRDRGLAPRPSLARSEHPRRRVRLRDSRPDGLAAGLTLRGAAARRM